MKAVVQRLTEPGDGVVVNPALPGSYGALLGDDRVVALTPLWQALAGHARDLQGAFSALATQVTKFAAGFSDLADLVRDGAASAQAGSSPD